MSRLLILLLAVTACKGDDTDTPIDTDSDDTEDPDPPVPDLDGTIAAATPLGIDLDSVEPHTPTALLAAPDAINPTGDRDFYTLDLTADHAYRLWVETGTAEAGNLLCDTVLRIYPPGATEAVTITPVEGDEPLLELGDLLVANDEFIYRYRDSDPGMVFVPTASGRHILEVIEYNDSIAGTAAGGPWCSYSMFGEALEPIETENNDLNPLGSALVDELAVAGQTTLESPFRARTEEFSGSLSSGSDADVWKYTFGDVGTVDGRAWWLWSLWPTSVGGVTSPTRLTLLDADFNVVARTDDAYPDGNYGFVEDPGLMHAVTSNSTWYLVVSREAGGSAFAPPPAAWANPATSGFYVGASHGYGAGLVQCPTSSANEVTWWEAESGDQDRNDTFNGSALMRFCKVGTSSLYVARIAGTIEPNRLGTNYVQPPPPEDEDTPRPTVEFPCGEGGIEDCPDREIFSIRQVSGAGGSIAGRRLRLSVQSRTVGSFVEPVVYLFSNNERVYPFASSDDGAEVDATAVLGTPDADLETRLPNDAEVIYVMVQAREWHPDNAEANQWFLRALID